MNFKSIFKKYLPAFIAIGLIVLIVAGCWFVGYLSERKLDRTVDNLQTNSQTAVREAGNANTAAINAQVTRQIEDGVREKVIAPKLETARRSSESSKIELKKLERKIKENEKKITDINADRTANCAELHRLFPDTRFEYCHD